MLCKYCNSELIKAYNKGSYFLCNSCPIKTTFYYENNILCYIQFDITIIHDYFIDIDFIYDKTTIYKKVFNTNNPIGFTWDEYHVFNYIPKDLTPTNSTKFLNRVLDLNLFY